MKIKPSLPWPLRIAGPASVCAIIAFLLLPVLVVTLASFNDKALLSFPPEHWSLRWFERVLTYSDFQAGFRSSLIVTAWSSVIALLIGTGVAITAKRLAFKGRDTLQGILMLPMVVPQFTIGLGLLILVAESRMERGYGVLVLCHVILVLPFVLRSVYVSMENLDERLEHAAASLGAPPRKVLMTVVVPLLAPGLFGGWLFAAILSFNEFTASLFITTEATQTLPVTMYNYVREFADPTLAALSVVYIVVTASLLAFANYFLSLGKILNIEESR
ncbi:ABC transporter permease [Paraburkholderia sp. BCC1886]|uniref:ABC transporter permease n=1 Tax=Paraburkholderia sp. BCC1886 TaxID=2562670 RepID=UPI0011844AC7|nr:ABC transporter permease [Paraburkholderia sp. BCC1886]